MALVLPGAGGESDEGFDDDSFGAPGDGLVGDAEPRPLPGVVQSLGLNTRAGEWPEFTHRPVAPVPDPGPHRVPPPRKASVAPGRSSSPRRGPHGTCTREKPPRTRPGRAGASTRAS